MAGKRLAGCLAAVLVVVTPALALATGGDKYLGAELDYRAVKSDSSLLHTPSLTLGGGIHISDFALLEGTLFYGLSYADDAIVNLAAATVAFRILVDATQWIPSIGPEVGYLAGYSEDDGLRHGFFAGVSACLDYRVWRTHSLALCGEYSVIPFQDDFESFWGLGVRINGFLPYMFE